MGEGIETAIGILEGQLTHYLEMSDYYIKNFNDYQLRIIKIKNSLAELKGILDDKNC